MVGVRPPHPTVQRLGGDHEAVGSLLTLPAEPVDFGGQRCQPVGFVAAQMRDSGQPRHRAIGGQCGQRRHRRCQLADVVQVHIDAAIGLDTLDLKVRITMPHNRTQLFQDRDDRIGGLDADPGHPSLARLRR